MTKTEILRRIGEIRDASLDDFEKTHALEDALRNDFIQCIANGKISSKYLQKKALMILSTNKIEFTRHCA